MERVLIEESVKKVGEEVKLAGWVDTVRDHGKITFIDLRDSSGWVQCVVSELKEKLTDESVIEIVGRVKERPSGSENKDIETGGIEIEVKELKVLNLSAELPLPVKGDGYDISEEVRLRYRYLDLRRERMKKNIQLRSRYVRALREYFLDHNFVEIETPILTKSTKEGARDFIVPSRLNKGSFYALPQSPQQYKQLLMTAGFEKYFQVARCIRDEDLRADRGFEHTQFDVEMSFVKPEDVMEFIEGAVKHAVKQVGGKIKDEKFPVIEYKEAIEKYGSDKFDLRTEEEEKKNILAFAWVVKFPFFKKVDKKDDIESADSKTEWVFTHNPFSMPIEEHIPWLLEGKNIGEILTTQYDLVCNGLEVGGGSIRAHRSDILKATYKVMGYSEEEIQESVGHMIEAFDLGTPPHGGIALGIDRHVMLIAGEESMKDVVAFPMTGTGKTSVMDAPGPVDLSILNELGIKIMVDAKNIIFDKLQKLFDYSDKKYKVLEHRPVKTSEEAASVRGIPLDEAVKAMVLKNKSGKFFMVCVPADKKINFGKVEKDVGEKLTFAEPGEVEVEFGVKVGAVPPVGKLFQMDTYYDQSIKDKGTVVFSAGRRDRSIMVDSKDLIDVAEPGKIGSFVE